MAGTEGERGALGRILADHEIEAEIGRGQHGVVWRARHRQLRRPVAVKWLAVLSDEHATRFRREAQVLASVDHPHVVTVYDYREVGDDRVIVMELLAGGTLADRFEAGIAPEAVVAAVLSAAAGLAQVHSQGILHRDVKPENLMFDGRGRLEVTDFGLAREDQLDTTALALTQAGSFFGTPAYAAPEQIGAAMATGWPPVSAASDQYSLAAVLYEGLSGRRTHDDSGGAVAFCNRRMHEEARPLGDLPVSVPVPPPVAAVAARALRRDPRERYPDCEAFGVALAEAAGAAWGPAWLERSDVPLLAPGPILGAVGGPVAPVEAGPSRARPGRSNPSGRRAAVPEPGAPPADGAAPSEAVVPARRRWPALVGAAAVLAVIGVAAFAVLGRGSGSGADDADPAAPREDVAVLDPVEIWSVRTGGPVFASPVVADVNGSTRVVVGSRDGTVYALDPSGRTVAWERETGGPVWTSAAVDRDTAYVGSDDGNLYALSLDDGSVRWSRPTGVGLVSSPAVHGNTVVVGADRLLAFDAESGEPRWTLDTRDVVISSPTIADGTVYVGTDAGDVHAVALVDGSPRWERTFDEAVRSSPYVHDDLVLVGADDGALHALDAATGRDRWTVDLGAPVRSSPTVDGSFVIVGTGAGRLVALDVATGEDVWSTSLPDRLDSSPLVLDGRVVIGGADGRVHLVDLVTGDRLGAFTTGGSVLSSPAALEDRFVVGSDDGMVYLVGGLGDP